MFDLILKTALNATDIIKYVFIFAMTFSSWWLTGFIIKEYIKSYENIIFGDFIKISLVVFLSNIIFTFLSFVLLYDYYI